MRPQTRAKIFIRLLDLAYGESLANIKMECQRWPEKPLILGRSGIQFLTMVTTLLSLYCGAHLVESYTVLQTFLIKKLAEISCSLYVIKIWLSVWFHHLANLHNYFKNLNICGTKIVNDICFSYRLLECLCFHGCFENSDLENSDPRPKKLRPSGVSKTQTWKTQTLGCLENCFHMVFVIVPLLLINNFGFSCIVPPALLGISNNHPWVGIQYHFEPH